MRRQTVQPRENWQATVAAQGLVFHTPEADARPYWDESACYELSAREVDQLEAAGNELQRMCLDAAQHVIDNKRYDELEIPAEAVPLIEWAWEAEPPAIYGRFDVLYDGSQPPKLLEYNADTPTSLLEAAVVQWYWLEDVRAGRVAGVAGDLGGADQFNSLHEKLIAKWRDVTNFLQQPVYFASSDNAEDILTTEYLRDTATQAGLATHYLDMTRVGWNESRAAFVDDSPEENEIRSIFKLYPWETMMEEAFAEQCLRTYREVVWIEPIWKMLLSNKGLLPILWELNRGHELLLEARFVDGGPGTGSSLQPPAPGWLRKPMHSREGANIMLTTPHGERVETGGPYTNRKVIDQRLGPTVRFAEAGGQARYPVLGLWMVDQECCGMGIREDATPITGNLSSFVPHWFR